MSWISRRMSVCYHFPRVQDYRCPIQTFLPVVLSAHRRRGNIRLIALNTVFGIMVGKGIALLCRMILHSFGYNLDTMLPAQICMLRSKVPYFRSGRTHFTLQTQHAIPLAAVSPKAPQRTHPRFQRTTLWVWVRIPKSCSNCHAQKGPTSFSTTQFV